MLTRQGHDLAVGRVIGAFDGNDLGGYFGVVRLQMLHQRGLCGAGADDQRFANRRQSLGDAVKIMIVVFGMSGADRSRFVVNVVRRIALRVDHEFLHIVGIELVDLGLAMIQPHDRMKMVHENLSIQGPNRLIFTLQHSQR